MIILAISGSFRAQSHNSSLLRTFAEAAPSGTTIDTVDYRDVPLYDQDAETDFPAVVSALKERIRAADGIIIATPEYNRGVPGVLKNLIDWTSRPYGDSAWAGKPILVIGASIAPAGAMLGQYSLKQSLLYLDAHVIGQPEFHLGLAGGKFDPEGNLTDDDTKAHIDSALRRFTDYCKTFR